MVAISGTNQCQYCVIAHGASLRIRAKNPLIADQVAINYRKADITPRQKAMLDFALKAAFRAAEVDDGELELLGRHGFGEEDIWDIGTIAAPSPPSLPSPTVCPTSPTCARTTSFSSWGSSPNRAKKEDRRASLP